MYRPALDLFEVVDDKRDGMRRFVRNERLERAADDGELRIEGEDTLLKKRHLAIQKKSLSLAPVHRTHSY